MKTATVILFLACYEAGLALAGQPLDKSYRDAAGKIIDAALEDTAGYEKLSYLCDRIGNRLSGSTALDRAIQWAAAQMKTDGLENVATLPVKVPHWVRGRESASIVEPVERPLHMLGLGGSIGTPAQGITAQVVVVSTFHDLESRGAAAVAGKIVLYNAPFVNYFETVQYRVEGASRAARLGAVAALVRSVTPLSLQSPHTGAMVYGKGARKIPAAAVSVEDATLIQRLADTGNRVVVHLAMEAQMLPDAESADVIGEIPGSENPEEIVVIGGHIDSWDVGQGAQDDGSGCIAALEAAALIRKLGLQPRRTIRVVFWTNEENGLAGASAYRAWIGLKLSNHVAAIEMDGGAEKPTGFGLAGYPHGAGGSATEPPLSRLREIGKLLDSIGAGDIQAGGGGADIEPLTRQGVLSLDLRTVGTHYFDWHHSDADTVDKIEPENLRLNIAAMAVMSYVLADMPDRLPGPAGDSTGGR
jgi:Zn-dependent M28 family amino/carboxypeptidase